MAEKPTYAELERKVQEMEKDALYRKNSHNVSADDLHADPESLEGMNNIVFEDLFSLEKIQRLQNEFADATGVASIITRTDGTPITKPSNFCRLCKDIIRKTEKGLANCFKSDSILGRYHPEGPRIQPCMSGGLWDAGAGITVGGKHIANWLIGQVRDEKQTEAEMTTYARGIGVDETRMIDAFREVPSMSLEQFTKIANMLFTLAKQLSESAYQNFQKAQFINERKQAEKQIAQSEEKYRVLVEASSDFIWEVDLDGVYTYVSPKIQSMLGYEPAEVIGKTPFDFMSANESDSVREKFAHSVGKRLPIVSLENENLHKNGHLVVMETSGVPIIDADGTIKGFRGVDRDITARREIQNRLKKSEELYRSVYSTAPLAFIVWDRGCRVLEWNDKARKLFGYDFEEVKGKNFFDLIIPEVENEAIQHVVENLLKGKIDKNIMHQNITKNGDLIWCEWNNSILRDENGEISGAMSLGLDITERINTDNKLKESERTYREIFNGSNDVIFIHDIETGAIVDVNSKVTDLYGYRPSEIIGKGVDSLSKGTPPFTVVEASKWIKKSIEEGPQIFEWMALSKKKEAFWVEVSLKMGLIAGKDRLMAVVRDIRERKVAEQELKEYREHLEELVEQRTAEIEAKNKELETFTYSVSHDLKAPLRGIDGYSRLLTEEYADKLDEEGLSFLANVRKSAEQMTQLIEDLLAYSRMERRSIHTVSIDLKALIEMLTFERQHDIESNHIQIDTKLPFDSIQVDADTFRQVLGNYLDNAIKFSRKQGQPLVEIGGNDNTNTWTIWVKDNGIGFDSKYHDRIFQIFQRLHCIEDYQGTGVGLAIVRKAVERIGGRVWAESVLGEGATFFMEIPKTEHKDEKENMKNETV